MKNGEFRCALNSPCTYCILVVILFCDFRNLHDGIHYLLHHLYAHELVRTMEVDATGKDVWTREALETELRTIVKIAEITEEYND